MVNEQSESKALLDVWAWKEEAWREVEHLDIQSAIRKRLADSQKTAEKLRHRLWQTAK